MTPATGPQRARGLLISAPGSNSGKTTITLGLLRALARTGRSVASAKAGPDYIDPRFHAAASQHECINLDPWAMRPALLRRLFAEKAIGHEMIIVEGMMGLFDGAADGTGSAADLAAMLGLPVILVIDVAAQSHSAAALARGFACHRDDTTVAGLILNRVGGSRHEAMLRSALEPVGIPVLGAVGRDRRLELPSRHLGLVQAGEHENLDAFLDSAGEIAADAIDLAALTDLAAAASAPEAGSRILPPLGQRMAIARDEAFAFCYPHFIDAWREAGAQLSFFSPLAGEPPPADADAIYLPGGYPELHGGVLAHNAGFGEGLRAAAERGATVYGECGGYMVLGKGIVDAEGTRHEMTGLLPLETGFEERRPHLGYRRLTSRGRAPWPGPLTGHEFHYATTLAEGPGEPLFEAVDARGDRLGAVGLSAGSVSGSFVHVIDLAS